MKVVLSRKGMDSTAGGMASPILPDGMLLSLPIPDKAGGQSYGGLSYKGQSYHAIIHQLNSSFDFSKKGICHFDPDIYENITGRPKGWKPAFGQSGISAGHLDRLGVGIGDIFLFYGMFQKTERRGSCGLSYVRGFPARHIIYGYMEVGGILREKQDIEQYFWHPHSMNAARPHNRLYVPKRYGTFRYCESLVLTKKEQHSRRLWRLPSFFADDGISVSWQGKNRPVLNGAYAELNSSRRGQEFVVAASTAKLEQTLREWAESLIEEGMPKTDGAAPLT